MNDICLAARLETTPYKFDERQAGVFALMTRRPDTVVVIARETKLAAGIVNCDAF